MRWVALVILILLMIASITNYILCKLEMKTLPNSYGSVIEVNGKKISYDMQGHGSKVVVLLSGIASPSPVLEMLPLAVKLADLYRVITIEYFGYGLSDGTAKERTVENITEEVHRVLQTLGYTKYILMAHSISGVYGLYYSNKYSEEVEAFVGIDPSVPKQNQYKNYQKTNLVLAYVARFFRLSGVCRGISKLFPQIFIKPVNGLERTREEKELLRKLYLNNLFNRTVMKEEKEWTNNFKKAENMHFPLYMPVLFFLSGQTSKSIREWYNLHEELVTDKKRSRIIMLEGTHYLHYQYSDDMVNIFKEWMLY